MVKVIFEIENFNGQKVVQEIKVAPGTTVLEAALALGLPLDHACEGSCACSTCHIIVNSGGDFLSAIEEAEEDRLDFAWNVQEGSRLSCQARLLEGGEIFVRIPKASLDPAKAVIYFGAPSMQPIESASSREERPVQFGWEAPESIAEALEAVHGKEFSIDRLRFTELLAWILALPGFLGTEEQCSEAQLEAVLAAWLELRQA